MTVNIFTVRKSTMKITIFNTSKATNILANCIQKYGSSHDLQAHVITPEHELELSATDLWHIANSDGILIFGTWGSTHKTRQWYPGCQKKLARLEFANQTAVKLAEIYKRRLIVIETSTFSRIRTNYIESNESHAKSYAPKFYRMGLDHWIYGKTTWAHPSLTGAKRLERFRKDFRLHYDIDLSFKDHEWDFNPDGFVTIFPGLEHDPTSTDPIETWIEDLLKTIPSYTKRRIALKPHPLSEIMYRERFKDFDFTLLGQKESLQSLKNQMYCGVLDSSTSVFELLDLGIPCVTSKSSFGAPFGNTDLRAINHLNLKSKDFYFQWAVEMSHTEFRLEEYDTPQIFPYLMYLLTC